ARRHYWVQDVEIQIAPSLASLTASRLPQSPRSLLLIGNPPGRPPDYPDLGYAATEMRSVETHFNNVTTLDGPEASPDGYAAARPEQFGFIHFTAHATANIDSPLDSA